MKDYENRSNEQLQIEESKKQLRDRICEINKDLEGNKQKNKSRDTIDSIMLHKRKDFLEKFLVGGGRRTN